MTFEFVLPLNRDDLLHKTGVNHYVVDEVFTARTLAGRLKDCQTRFRAEGPLCVLTNFDTYFSTLVHFTNVESDIQKELWNQLIRVTTSLPATLVESLDQTELCSDNRQTLLNALKMTSYLLCQTCSLYESIISKPATTVVATKGRKKPAKTSAMDICDVDWEEERERGIRALLQLMQLNVQRLWDPPIAEEEFVSLITNICYKLLENPNIAKTKSLRDAIFQLLGIMVKRFNHTIGCTLKMVQLLQQFEHLAVPFAQAVELFVNNFGVKGIVSELMREIGRMDPKELARDSSGTRAYAAFILELARCVPAVMLPSISVLLVLLDGESYTMRNSVLGVLGEMVQRVLSGGELDQKQKSTRDQFLDKLEDHVHDVNAFVRSRILQIWLSIVTEKALPLPRQNGLLTLVIGRLQDKSCQVRKNAVQLVIALIRMNPLAAQLTVDELRANYEKERDNLKSMMPEPVQDDAITIAVQTRLDMEWNGLEKQLRKVIKTHLRKKEGIYSSDEDDETKNNSIVQLTEDDTMDSLTIRMAELLKNSNLTAAVKLLEAMKTDFPNDPILSVTPSDGGDEDINSIHNRVEAYTCILKSFFFSGAPSKNSADDHDSSMVNAISKQQVLVQYLKDSMNFVIKIDESIPIMCQLLWSKTPTDVLEAVDFFVSGFEAGVTACLLGIRRMLSLIRSKEPSVKSAVVDAYKRIYLNAKGANPRAEAITIANSLIALTISGASLGDLASLTELIQEFVRTGDLSSKVIQVLWEKFALKIVPTSPAESRGALILIGMAAGAEVETVRSNLNTLIKEGLGTRAETDFSLARDTCLALLRLTTKAKSNDYQKPFRFEKDHELFDRLRHLLTHGLTVLDRNDWIPMAEQAVNLIYRLAEHPDDICADIIKKQAKAIALYSVNNAEHAGDGDGDMQMNPSNGSSHNSEINCASSVVARFVFFCGHVALQELIHLDVAVFGELKRRRAVCEKDKTDKTGGKSKAGGRASISAASVAKSAARLASAGEQTIEEEMGLAGAVAEDAEAECIRRITETQVVTGSETLLAVLQPLIVAICSNPSKYKDPRVCSAATLALTKFMIVSSEFCEQNLQLLFTILEKSQYATVRANVVTALGDLTFRFPNLIEPWTANIYARLRDDSTLVRKNTLLVLTHLILNDMIKVKGQISELATCVIDDNPQISELAKIFFSDLAKRGNSIYNILPDVISRLSDPEVGISEDNFRSVLRYLMSFIQKDRQCESLVEKLCHRFRATQSERQWRDLAFCLSLLSYNDKSVRKLQENFVCFSDKLAEDFVFECFNSIIANARKFVKPEAKAIIDEFEQRLAEIHTKGVADDAVAQKASLASKAAKVSKTAKTPGRKGRGVAVKHKAKNSEDEDDDDDDDENDDEKSRAVSKTAVKQSQRPRPPKQRQVLKFSSDEEDDDFAVASSSGVNKSKAKVDDCDDKDDVDVDVLPKTKRVAQSVASQRVSRRK